MADVTQAVQQTASAVVNTTKHVNATLDAVTNATSGVAATVNNVAMSSSDLLTVYLGKALEKTGNVIDKAVDMVQEQAPLLVHEVLVWYGTLGLIKFITAVLLMTVGNYVIYRLVKKLWAAVGEPTIILAIASEIVLSAASIHLFNLDWLKIWLAPRLWLIEYATNMMKATNIHH